MNVFRQFILDDKKFDARQNLEVCENELLYARIGETVLSANYQGREYGDL